MTRYAVSMLILAGCTLYVQEAVSARPTRQQIVRLVEQLQVPVRVVDSLEVVYYSKTTSPGFDPNRYYENERAFLDRLTGIPKEKLEGTALQERIKMEEFRLEVARKQAELGVLHKVRVIMDSNRLRQDIAYGQPDMVLFPGTNREQKLPAKILGPDTPYEETIVWIWDANQVGFEAFSSDPIRAFRYDHEHYLAIERLEDPILLRRSRRPPNQWLSEVGLVPRLWLLPVVVGKRIMVDKGSDSTARFQPDEQKIESICRGEPVEVQGFGKMLMTVSKAVEETITLDRFELVAWGEEGRKRVVAVYAFDSQDYSRCYYEELYDKHGRPVSVVRRSGFKEDWLPRYVEKYNFIVTRDQVQSVTTYQIETIVANAKLPDELFEFHPPDGYQVAKSSSVPIRYYKRGDKTLAVPMED